MKQEIFGKVVLPHVEHSPLNPTKHVKMKEVMMTKKFRLLAIPTRFQFYSVLMDECRVVASRRRVEVPLV